MIVRNNIHIYDICWLNHADGGMIGTYYEPETKDELAELCQSLYKDRKSFDIIGYTSNIYFLPNYSADIIVSTRKVKNFKLYDSYIEADCGARISNLSRIMVNSGVKGFEGLVDLPGTIGAAIYGNAGCYGCSISNLLIEADVLFDDGIRKIIKPKDFQYGNRTSLFKQGVKQGVILSVKLKAEQGDKEQLKEKAAANHLSRQINMPQPAHSLGSIFSDSGKPTLLHFALKVVCKVYDIILNLVGVDKTIRLKKRRKLFFSLLNASEIEPYVPYWNWYRWTDARAHECFDKYVKLHRRLYSKSVFEIVIKK